MSKQTITDSEYEVMKILWTAEEPLGLGEIMRRLPDNRWTRNTVATLLARLSEKGIAGYEKHGKVNMYFAAMKKEDYSRKETKSLLSRLYNGSIKNLVAALYEKEEITGDELDALRKMLDGDKQV